MQNPKHEFRDKPQLKHPVKRWRSPCPKVKCLKCANFDPEYTYGLGFTCLVKSINPDPSVVKACCWFVMKGQTRFLEFDKNEVF